MSKLINLVDNNAFKKKVHDKLVAKINANGTSGPDKKSRSITQRKKSLILVELLKKTGHNAKITEVEAKIPSITYWLSYY